MYHISDRAWWILSVTSQPASTVFFYHGYWVVVYFVLCICSLNSIYTREELKEGRPGRVSPLHPSTSLPSPFPEVRSLYSGLCVRIWIRHTPLECKRGYRGCVTLYLFFAV